MSIFQLIKRHVYSINIFLSASVFHKQNIDITFILVKSNFKLYINYGGFVIAKHERNHKRKFARFVWCCGFRLDVAQFIMLHAPNVDLRHGDYPARHSKHRKNQYRQD